MTNPIIDHLKRYIGLDEKEAQQAYRQMQKEVYEGRDPEDVLYEIGLEPDYIFDLI